MSRSKSPPHPSSPPNSLPDACNCFKRGETFNFMGKKLKMALPGLQCLLVWARLLRGLCLLGSQCKWLLADTPLLIGGGRGRGCEGWGEWQTLPWWPQPSHPVVQTSNYLRLLPRMRWALIIFTWAETNRCWILNIWGWSCKNWHWGLIYIFKNCWHCIKEHFPILLVIQAIMA